MDTQPCADGRVAGGCGWINTDNSCMDKMAGQVPSLEKKHKMRTEINERGRGMTEKARMGTDHQESVCSKSSRKPSTKHGPLS